MFLIFSYIWNQSCGPLFGAHLDTSTRHGALCSCSLAQDGPFGLAMASPMAFEAPGTVPGYADKVSARLLANDMASLMEWTHLRESSVTEHIDQIFAMAAMEDTAGEIRAVSSHFECGELWFIELDETISVSLCHRIISPALKVHVVNVCSIF